MADVEAEICPYQLFGYRIVNALGVLIDAQSEGVKMSARTDCGEALSEMDEPRQPDSDVAPNKPPEIRT